MPFDWHSQPDEVLEQHYNPRVAVPDFQAYLERNTAQSAAVRQRLAGEYDLRYGPRPLHTFDVHRAQPHAPVTLPLVLFIHGGYWRGSDKRDYSFVAPLFVETGATLANVNYALCPDVTLDEIVSNMCQAVRYFTQHATALGAAARLFLVGHSAGAHLIARLLAQDWAAAGLPAEVIEGAVLLSGIYEPEVVLHLSVNADVRLSAAMAQRQDCLCQPPRRNVPLLIAVGGAEPAGWIAQSRAYHDVCRQAGLDSQWHLVDGANHFSIVQEAVTPGTPLAEAIITLLRGAA